MTERIFEELLPNELNAELHRYFDQLPKFSDSIDELAWKKPAAFRLVFLENLKKLLVLSPGSNSFKEYLSNFFATCSIDGVPHDIGIKGASVADVLFDSGVEGSAGIFEYSRVEDIECTLLQNFQKDVGREIVELEESGVLRSTWPQKHIENERLVYVWTREFSNLYGKSP